MWIKRNKMLLKRALLLLVIILLVGGLAASGCAARGTLPRGWSGGAVADGTLFVGSEQGRLVAINLAEI